MTESADITTLGEDLQARLGAKLGLRRGSLAVRLQKAGWRLPRRIKRDGAAIGQAIELAAHPKLRRRVNQAEIGAAHRRVAAYLDGIDPNERRARLMLGLLGGLVFNLLLLGALTIAFLKWRGMI